MTEATHQLLEQHFDTAFAAPDGIARLRELILTLAMQGKLVEQDPNDPLALELLKAIEVDKKYQVTAGKGKKAKSLPVIDQANTAYVLPQSWTWTRSAPSAIFLTATASMPERRKPNTLEPMVCPTLQPRMLATVLTRWIIKTGSIFLNPRKNSKLPTRVPC